MSDEDAYMALVLNNAQGELMPLEGELMPLEIELRQLGSGRRHCWPTVPTGGRSVVPACTLSLTVFFWR